jgi:ADP-ribose pyrophosphatase YjhB (NUDIX family)
MNVPKYFRIGVYGLLLQNGKLLITKENIKGQEVIKFPGGGLQFGEGIKDALVREFQEELGISVRVMQFIYINDFYVQSAIDANYQVIAIYYLVKSDEKLPTHTFVRNNILFEWIILEYTNISLLTFETDKRAFSELLKITTEKG